MPLSDDLSRAVAAILAKPFSQRVGRVVPTTHDVGFGEAVKVKATFLYADLKDSSGLVKACQAATVGKVLRVYLDVAARLVKRNGGEIRSFDGDRIMAIYIGPGAANRSVQTALQLKWACENLLQPQLEKRFVAIPKAKWKVQPATGIATGEALMVRGGVRRHSDLVSVGLAPNLAAKLSDIRSPAAHLKIDGPTHYLLTPPLSGERSAIRWTRPSPMAMAGVRHPYYATTSMQAL